MSCVLTPSFRTKQKVHFRFFLSCCGFLQRWTQKPYFGYHESTVVEYMHMMLYPSIQRRLLGYIRVSTYATAQLRIFGLVRSTQKYRKDRQANKNIPRIQSFMQKRRQTCSCLENHVLVPDSEAARDWRSKWKGRRETKRKGPGVHC